MSIDVETDLHQFEKLQKQGFDMSLGYWFWNMAVMIAPYDTGATRSSIMLKKNKPKRIKISYDLSKAVHVKFLEEGVGPVKKYKDFIKKDTAESIAEQLVSWIITGKSPSYAMQGIKPFIVLKTSKHNPFSWEQTLLKQANMNTNSINAKTRSQISKIRETTHTGYIQRSSGKSPSTLSSGRNNAGVSNLQKIYKERVSKI
jgi:hypothetical protein